jgi:hypothetical protein
VTKAAVTEMSIANLDHFGRRHGFPRPNGFSAPVRLFFRLPLLASITLLSIFRCKMVKFGVGCQDWRDHSTQVGEGAARAAPVIACGPKMPAAPEGRALLRTHGTAAAVRFANGKQGRLLPSGLRVRSPCRCKLSLAYSEKSQGIGGQSPPIPELTH